MRFAEVPSSLDSDRCGAEADAHTSTRTDCKQKCHRQDKEGNRGKLKAKFRESVNASSNTPLLWETSHYESQDTVLNNI